jgi:transmembrane sensor
MKQHAAPLNDTAEHDDADAREFDDYAHTQNLGQVEAALWATRRTEGLDAAAEAEFEEWLRADSEHATAYEEMEKSFDPVRELPDDRIHSLKEGLRQPAPAGAPSRGRPSSTVQLESFGPRPVTRATQLASPGRRAWLADIGRVFPSAATAMAGVALVGGGWMGWHHWHSQPTLEKSYATARGQRLDVRLPDGSILQLDAATQADVRLYRARREVRLLEGQALFVVHADPQQPFDVLAGAVRVTVVGTRFSVRHTRAGVDAGKTVVAVESGRVRVSRMGSSGEVETDNGAGRVELSDGQAVSADEMGRMQSVVSVPPDSVAGWRNGRISFNDTPLAEALAELERYGDTGLVVRDPAVGALRLGGSFDVRQTGAFAQALPALLPVRLERRNGVVEIVGLH